MAKQRQFLGWDGPALPRAVDWLRDRYVKASGWDLSELVVVVPSATAGRRLLELLVLAANDGLTPPSIVTPGELPSLLVAPDKPVADELTAALARAAVLRRAEAGVLERIVPHPPGEQEWAQWWALATQMQTMAEELAASGLTMGQVVDTAAQRGHDLRGEDRWQALAQLDEAYHQLLDELGMVDRSSAERSAIEAHACRCESPIVLVGASDLNHTITAMLMQCDGEMTALIHAPESHAAGFDELGGLVAEYWRKQQVKLDDDMLRFVDRPSDQAYELVRTIAETAADTYAADQITVGLGDENAVETFRRAIELAGLPARYAAGRSLTQARPVSLLAAVGRFCDHRRFNDLAELLRHPDMHRYLQQASDAQPGDAGGTQAIIQHWLTLLDQYAAEHLQEQVDGRWLGDADQQAQLKAMWERVGALLPGDAHQRRPLPAWSESIARSLSAVYGDVTLARHSPEDEPIIRSLQAVAEALREQADLDAHSPITPEVTATQAIALTLSRLRDKRVPEQGGEPAIELAGFLQLQLDDAPMAIVTNVNEGAVPSSHTADAFLPNSLRSALGMPDNDRRYARDLMMLQAIVCSRESVTLIAGRRSVDGEPIAPSRLLLACDDQTLVQRVLAFYKDEGQAVEPALLLSPGGRDAFLIPQPALAAQPLERMRVTAFRDYIACPYRFYLRHVLRLQGLDDRVVEMDPLGFGSLAHRVLETFGKSELAASDNPQAIAAFLGDTLDVAARQHFGSQWRPALRVQVEQLRHRLESFAYRQAQWAHEGWRIMQDGIERDYQTTIDVDGQPFTITGRIDRIDHHPKHGYRILDYKTSDTAKTPDKTHRMTYEGELRWVDLQLPLYRTLVQHMKLTGDIALGYINLPKTLGADNLAIAEWDEDELGEAEVLRDEIIRQVRAQVFWPPNLPPDWPDEFTGMCADNALDRAAIIAASKMGDWGVA